MKRIAIQGTLGSYHDIAAHKYFEGEEIELLCCATFEDVFAAVKRDSQTIGMLAIENTIAGSLLHNNELLRQSGTQIIGEYKLRISHSFVCLPEEDWDDITEVNSHPIALMQCRDFLNRHPRIKVVEGEDTALSAETIKRENLKGHAAICSKAAGSGAGRHRDEQTQLHPLSGCCRPVASGRNTTSHPSRNQQGKHRIHPTAHGRKPVASALHTLVLPHQPDQNTVAAHHRTGMGIPVLRRCGLRQHTEIQTSYRGHHTAHQRT